MIRAPRNPSSFGPDPGLTLHRTVLLHTDEAQPARIGWGARASELTAIVICIALVGIVVARLLLG